MRVAVTTGESRTLAPAEGPFGSIEDAHQYLTLLATVIEDARQAIQGDIDSVRADEVGRRRDLLQLIDYKLAQLRSHVGTSARLLNDLRTLRRILLDERRHAA